VGRLLGGAGLGHSGGVLLGDAVGEVGGVVVDETEQRRAAGVLPRRAVVERIADGPVAGVPARA
jgi:hypothetical protein